MGRERRLGRLQSLARLSLGDEILDQRTERGAVDRPRQVELCHADRLDARRRTGPARLDGGDLGRQHPPLAGEFAESPEGPVQDLPLTGAVRDSDRQHQALRVAGPRQLIARQDRDRLLAAAEGLEQAQQTEHRFPVSPVGADRLDVLRQRSVVVAQLLGSLCHKQARDAVARPQAQACLQRFEGLCGLSAGQEQAAAQQIHDQRVILEDADGLVRLVVVAGTDQQIHVGSQQRGGYLNHRRQALLHGVPRLCQLVALFVVVRQAEPGLTVVHAVPRGAEQQSLGLCALSGDSQPVRQGLDEGQVGSLRLVGPAQDLGGALWLSALGEELDRAEYDDLFGRELLQAIVPQRLGCVGVSLLLREGRGGSAGPRLPVEFDLRALYRRADRGERALRLVDPVEIEQGQQT